MPDTLHTTAATAVGGGQARVSSADGRLEIELSVQSDLGGDDGPGTNPEQLFAAGYAACFLQALESVARMDDVEVGAWSVTATVALVGHLSQGMDLTARLEVDMAGVDRETATRLVDAAYAACPYSRATRGGIEQDVVLAPARR